MCWDFLLIFNAGQELHLFDTFLFTRVDSTAEACLLALSQAGLMSIASECFAKVSGKGENDDCNGKFNLYLYSISLWWISPKRQLYIWTPSTWSKIVITTSWSMYNCETPFFKQRIYFYEVSRYEKGKRYQHWFNPQNVSQSALTCSVNSGLLFGRQPGRYTYTLMQYSVINECWGWWIYFYLPVTLP